MTTAYTALYDDVFPELPGADAPLVLHTIKRTLNDFYERSLYSREVLSLDVVAGQADYTPATALSEPAVYEIGKILDVRLMVTGTTKPKQLLPRSQHQLSNDMPDWDTRQGTPRFYTQKAIDTLTLAYIPADSITAGLKVTVSKLPLYGGTGFDTFIYEKFAESLAAGVKARMMRMPKKPWSNPGLAQAYMREFDQEVAAAAAIAAKNHGEAPLRSKAWA